MKKRLLTDDLEVSSIGFGAMGLSEFYGKTNDDQSMVLLKKLIDLDVNFIDTANMYGDGHNERLIGKFLNSLDKSTQHKMTIATKCGIDRPLQGSYDRAINNSPKYITQCCNNSLERLGTECIDLFYLHRVDKHSQIEESMDCLAQLIKDGKIKHIGLCEVSASTLRKAHAVHPVTALQTEYSLWSRDVEDEILPTVKELNIGFVPYSPLGRGFLTGKYLNNSSFDSSDFRKNNERFLQENLDHNSKLLAEIQPIAKKYSATVGQVSLAWLLAQYEKIVPIPGTKHIDYLIENARAADLVIDRSDIIKLNNISSRVLIKGDRYSIEGMKGVNV